MMIVFSQLIIYFLAVKLLLRTLGIRWIEVSDPT